MFTFTTGLPRDPPTQPQPPPARRQHPCRWKGEGLVIFRPSRPSRLARSNTLSVYPDSLLDSFLSVGRGEKSLRGQTSKSKRKSGSCRLSARPRPPVLDARPPLRRQWWGKARGCPSPACLQRSWWSPAPRFVLWLDPPFGANGARRHIWQRSVTTNRLCVTVASVDYFHACMARGSQRAVGQALQPICLQRAHGPICSQGVRGYLSTQASVNKP